MNGKDVDTEGCGAPVAPHDGSNAASWSVGGEQLTIHGAGAFMGLARVFNEGELQEGFMNDVPESITYEIVQLTEGGMTLWIQFSEIALAIPVLQSWITKGSRLHQLSACNYDPSRPSMILVAITTVWLHQLLSLQL